MGFKIPSKKTKNKMLNISFTQTLPGADLIVATVGRLYDFVRAGIINLEDRFRGSGTVVTTGEVDLWWLVKSHDSTTNIRKFKHVVFMMPRKSIVFFWCRLPLSR